MLSPARVLENFGEYGGPLPPASLCKAGGEPERAPRFEICLEVISVFTFEKAGESRNTRSLKDAKKIVVAAVRKTTANCASRQTSLLTCMCGHRLLHIKRKAGESRNTRSPKEANKFVVAAVGKTANCTSRQTSLVTCICGHRLLPIFPRRTCGKLLCKSSLGPLYMLSILFCLNFRSGWTRAAHSSATRNKWRGKLYHCMVPFRQR